jgi:hypothetical protein
MGKALIPDFTLSIFKTSSIRADSRPFAAPSPPFAVFMHTACRAPIDPAPPFASIRPFAVPNLGDLGVLAVLTCVRLAGHAAWRRDGDGSPYPSFRCTASFRRHGFFGRADARPSRRVVRYRRQPNFRPKFQRFPTACSFANPCRQAFYALSGTIFPFRLHGNALVVPPAGVVRLEQLEGFGLEGVRHRVAGKAHGGSAFSETACVAHLCR